MALTNPLVLALAAVIGGGVALAPRSPARPQPAAFDAVQADCPESSAFAAASAQRVTLPRVALDTVWTAVRGALSKWRDSLPLAPTKRAAAAVRLEAPFLMVETVATAQAAKQTGQSLARTCFAAGRSDEGLDYRIAFLFAARARGKNGTVLDIRWIGQRKGRGERLWQPDEVWAPRAGMALLHLMPTGR